MEAGHEDHAGHIHDNEAETANRELVENIVKAESFETTTANRKNSHKTAVPHTQVETQELYKHISQDLIEPKRMRQLLMWCGDRALPDKPGGQLKPDETAAMHAGNNQRTDCLLCVLRY